MNKSEATVRLEALLMPWDDPALSLPQFEHLLSLARTVDADGNKPTDDGWQPTYSTTGIYRAAAEGWQIKHGLAVGRFNFAADGQRFDRAQLVDHCAQQSTMWRRKLRHSLSTGSD